MHNALIQSEGNPAHFRYDIYIKMLFITINHGFYGIKTTRGAVIENRNLF
jgi:hypothetical protein